MPKPKYLHKNAANFCRAKRWRPGVVFTVEVGPVYMHGGRFFEIQYRITAIGDTSILVRRILRNGELGREEAWNQRLLRRPVAKASGGIGEAP